MDSGHPPVASAIAVLDHDAVALWFTRMNPLPYR